MPTRRESRPAPADDPAPAAPVPASDDDHGVLYIGADFGYSWINLVQFSSNNFIPVAERRDGSGWSTALSAGFRILWFTVGGRGTLSSYPGFEVGTVGLDLGLHLPIPVFEPYVRGGLSYGWMGNANYSNPNLSDTSVTGLVADAGAGVDIYLNDHISIGAGVDAVFLNLTRQKISASAGTMVGDVNISESGDAVGLQLRFHGQLVIHI
ncbi:MAG: outer membrane beta-barrel protein [Deltaproteobacteria bacterium]|nr:outer membrane beta-barrel protein [Deltaproteobacteria bacterium]